MKFNNKGAGGFKSYMTIPEEVLMKYTGTLNLINPTDQH